MAGALSRSTILGYTGGSTKGADILAASKKYGFNADDVDKAFRDTPGYTPGTSQKWIDQNTYSDGNVVESTTPWFNLKSGVNTAGTSTSVPTPAPGTVAGYTPEKVATIDKPKFETYTAEAVKPSDDSLVEKRLQGVLSRGNPLFQLEETKALQEANRRGVINSTMAIGMGRRNVMDKALQIVSPDAQTFANAEQANAAATNRSREFGANAANQATELGTRVNADLNITNANAGNRATEFGANAANQSADTATRIQADKELAAQRVTAEKELAKINADFDMEVQKLRGTQQETSDATMAQNNRVTGATNAAATIMANANAALAQIWANPDTSVEAKNQSTRLLLDKTSRDVKFIGAANDIDFGTLLEFVPSTPAPTTEDTGSVVA